MVKHNIFRTSVDKDETIRNCRSANKYKIIYSLWMVITFAVGIHIFQFDQLVHLVILLQQ